MLSTTNCHDSSFSYRGKVTIQSMRRNKLVATHTSFNHGLLKLFNSLCSTLVGTGTLDDLVPTYIRLYTISDSADEQLAYASYSWKELCEAQVVDGNQSQAVLQPVTSFLPINSATVQNGTSSPIAVFQVKIPYDLITSEKVYAMALYPKRILNSDNPEADALAYYTLTTAANWNPIIINPGQYDYNLLVEWQMDFANVTQTL